ncbi:hypothetical protein RRG08_007871 [Elysia crispata]|uniref:Uncharacterized protein n=1 Tax=Elysia crispata TaxID=231223 RepID=A0AAE1CNJ3_9GAST|nr:hypothetical protein RRG08_007871 [Elysia crispata]
MTATQGLRKTVIAPRESLKQDPQSDACLFSKEHTGKPGQTLITLHSSISNGTSTFLTKKGEMVIDPAS